MKFRNDINGLRAIAVIAVVLFHFNASWLPGGFAGVDVFFVISGFLMTGIIFRGLESGNFSIIKFYIARANRIIPALAVLCVALLLFGWFYFSSLDYKVLGKQVTGSISFISNILYWKESGYFDASSHEKWLLHTWSLSVEWQFYLIYPLLLVAIRRFLLLALIRRALLGATVFGFVFCIIATHLWPSSSYYFLTTRAWEMMIGGVCYLYPFHYTNSKKYMKIIVEWTGISFIIVSYIFFDKDIPWPGTLAIVPVLGACLIIQAQRNDSFITNNFIFQKLGAWSYSIYLWHWPIAVVIYFYTLNSVFVYIGIVLSILLGALSYHYIERIKFRNNFESFLSYWQCKPLHILFIIGVIGVCIFLSKGANFRLSEENLLLNINARHAVVDWEYPAPNLQVNHYDIRFIKGKTDKNILFIGASHIEQIYPYVIDQNSEFNIYFLTQGGCFITPSYKPNVDCSNIKDYKKVIEEINFEKIVTSLYLFDAALSEDESVKKVQLATRVSEFNDFLAFGLSKSKKIFLILGEPKGREFDPKQSVRHGLKGYISVKEARQEYVIQYKALESLAISNTVTLIDPIESLCTDICKVWDDKFNYYYKDATHMRPWYAKKSLSYLNPIFK